MKNRIVENIKNCGITNGDIVLVHSAFKSLGIENPEDFLSAMIEVIGHHGTLLLPCLSYEQNPHHIHDTNTTPSCVGFLSEYFRKRTDTKRSVHPTHSVCAYGYKKNELLENHILDKTPCGYHSPFNKLFYNKAKIVMVGCGLKPNTSMHAIEEYVQPPYLFGAEVNYKITDHTGKTFTKAYITHNFAGYIQRYDRIENLMTEKHLKKGIIGKALTYVIDSEAFFETALKQLKRDCFYFVDNLDYSQTLATKALRH